MKIELLPYDANWPLMFEDLKVKLLAAIGHLQPEIEHIGSTSIPGLMSKPTIDIQIGMPSEKALNALHQNLIPKGFTRNARWDRKLPFRRFFLKLGQRKGGPKIPSLIDENFKGDVRSQFIAKANIHCTEKAHPWHADHLLFRDFLLSDEESRRDYQNFKLELAKKEWELTADYAGAKDEIISIIKTKAKLWQQRR